MWARSESRHAGAWELPRPGFEVPGLDPLDRRHHHGAAAIEVILRQRPFAVLLQAGRPADAEYVLAHASPDPVLRIPEREKPRLEPERLPFVVETVLAGEVVQRQLHVMKLGPEVHLVCEAHRLA